MLIKKFYTDPMDKDKEFLEFIVKTIVNNPSAVKIDRVVDEMGVLLTLNIDPADMGNVIGRQGQTAKAIRTLLNIVGAKNHARVNLKIVEPEGSTHTRRSMDTSVETVNTDVIDDLKI